MKRHPSYVEGLTNRIADALEASSLRLGRLGITQVEKDIIRKEVKATLHEIQHWLYQDVIGEALELAKTIDPSEERKA